MKKSFLWLALPFAAKMVGGRPAPEEGVIKLQLTITQCTAKDVSQFPTRKLITVA